MALKPLETTETAPSPASPNLVPDTAPAPLPAAPVAPQVIVQMMESKASEPTPGLSEGKPGGEFKHNGKTYDAFLKEIV